MAMGSCFLINETRTDIGEMEHIIPSGYVHIMFFLNLCSLDLGLLIRTVGNRRVYY